MTLLRSLTPAQLKDPATEPATLLADCARPLTLEATDAVPLDFNESKAVLASSSSSLWLILSLEAASLACSMYFSLLASLKLKYLRLYVSAVSCAVVSFSSHSFFVKKKSHVRITVDTCKKRKIHLHLRLSPTGIRPSDLQDSVQAFLHS